MGRVSAWWRRSIFPEAYRRTEILSCGLAGLAAGVAPQLLRVAFPSLIPEWFTGHLSLVAGVALFMATALAVLVASDAKRTRRLFALETPRLGIVVRPCCLGVPRGEWDDTLYGFGVTNPSAETIDGVLAYLDVLDQTQRVLSWAGQGPEAISIDPTPGPFHRHVILVNLGSDGHARIDFPYAPVVPLPDGEHVATVYLIARNASSSHRILVTKRGRDVGVRPA